MGRASVADGGRILGAQSRGFIAELQSSSFGRFVARVDPRPHPFPSKLTPDQAQEVRRLRARGLPLTELAEKFGIAKSSVSAIVHLKAHGPPGTLPFPSSSARSSPRLPRTTKCRSSRSPPTSSSRFSEAVHGDRNPEADLARAYGGG